MHSHERIVAVCMGRPFDPTLEEAIQALGYEPRRATSVEDVFRAADREANGPVVVLTAADGVEQVERLLIEAAERMPSARFIVSLPDRNGEVEGFCPPAVGSERILWISAGADASENAQRVRGFLLGDGYKWASDLDPGARPGRRQSDNVASHLERRREDEAKKLLAFAASLSAHTDAEEMLRGALQKSLELLHCDAGSIYLWDERTETLILKAAEGPEQDKRLGLRQKLGEGLAGWVAEVGEPILVTDARKVHWLRGRVCRRYSNFRCLAAPLMHGDQLFGVLCLTMPKDNKSFAPEDLQLTTGLAQKLGALLRPLSFLSELRYFNDRLVKVVRSCSELVVEKDTQVEAMRALSSDILDGIPLAVIAYDRHLRVCFSNAAAHGLFGMSLQDAEGRKGIPLEGRLDVDPEAWRSKLQSVSEGRCGFRLERVSYAADGQSRTLDVRGSPLHASDGASIGGVLTVQDVTEDVEMEAKLSAAERLALIGTIAAKVAHELNNPLDGILRFLNLAMRQLEDDPEQARSYLEESRRGLMRMGNIVGQLLAFSRGHRAAGRPMSLSHVIRHAVALYEERARGTNIRIRMEVPADLPACASAEMYDVFGNVIKNALDAMGRDGVLTVRAKGGNGAVAFTFADTGPGVPEEIRDKIFEPFFTTKRDGTGTGLGLAACRDTLSRIGGDIRLGPSERGATFEVVVPVNQQ
jgi:PAS domain S-box-containing protein